MADTRSVDEAKREISEVPESKRCPICGAFYSGVHHHPLFAVIGVRWPGIYLFRTTTSRDVITK